MGSTMTQKLLAAKCGQREVRPGQLVMCSLDMVLGNDITAPVAIREFERLNRKEVFNKRRIALVPDHFVPNKDIKSAQQAAVMRQFARRMEIENYFEAGRAGIEHALLPELGLVTAGDCVIGADSHTCTYGALGAFSTGVGSTDMACAMAVGKTWFKVPSAVKVRLKGKLSKYVTGKDVILSLIGRIGVDGALYQSLEFTGDGVKEIPMDGRLTIANMAIEAGAKNGIFPVDDVCREYLKGRVNREWTAFEADADAEYSRTVTINLDELDMTVSLPHLPENTQLARDCKQEIDQVVIGSCTNGRLEDMEAAYNILKGKHIAKGVRGIIIPATMAVYKECILRGWTTAFIDAGCIVSTPTCGPCLGGYMGILAAGERCVSTTNRNFVGRMGHVDSEVYLASPATAAASALTGYITDPRTV